MSNSQIITIGVDDLVPGHFVSLDVPWKDHPFLFSRFMIGSQKDIAVIRALGVRQIDIVPDRCRADLRAGLTQLAARAAGPTKEQIAEDARRQADQALREELALQKEEMLARDAQFRAERNKIATRFQDTVKKVSSFAQDLRSGPANAVMAAEQIVDDMLQAFEQASEVLVNLVNLSDANFTTYTHALNVTVLSVLLARFLKLDSEEVRGIGMGALLHDIGKLDIPAKITNKTGKLMPAEEALLRTHPLKGLRMAEKVQPFPPEAAAVIANHHEYLDGSGYPRGLKDAQLWLSVRIVTIANTYDNLCNPPDPAQALSPRDAMASLYKNYRDKLDGDLVAAFIKAMGVYPPGTIVRLSDGNIGMVVSVDPDQLLRPRVILYNPDIPRWNAMMADLRESKSLEVAEVLKPGDCPPQLYEYLGIGERLGYFYEQR
jgi:putative nucleotidyltransferase with HDIG domain